MLDDSKIPLPGMSDLEPKVIPQQLWAMLARVVNTRDEVQMVFRNVPRHSGAEAWRRITEPMTEGKELRRKTYQPRVLNPKSVTKIEHITSAIESWESDYRLFRESGGEELQDEQRRMIFIDSLPPDIAVHVTMNMIHYPTYATLKAFVRNYVRIVMHQRNVSGNNGINVFDRVPDDDDKEFTDADYGEDGMSMLSGLSVD